MATYAIGDIQGCYQSLLALLKIIEFDAAHDHLWLVGDLVNRGPNSLAVLRFLHNLPQPPVIVLGNHDLHLLAVVFADAEPSPDDTLAEILLAHDCEPLCHGLRHGKFFHYDRKLGYGMAHAGVWPGWDLAQAQKYAEEVESVLRGPTYKAYLKEMYGDEPADWTRSLQGMRRWRFITNSFTRMRYCDSKGKLKLDAKGAPHKVSPDYIPWFQVPGRVDLPVPIIFGHWAALDGKVDNSQVVAIDTGCVWGRKLTAIRLEDRAIFQVDSQENKA